MGLMWDLITVIVIFQWEHGDFMGFIWLDHEEERGLRMNGI